MVGGAETSPTSQAASTTELATIRTELAARRTGMSFQRTRLAADRTLMAVIRTSLSLITFGFSIDQIFTALEKHKVVTGGALTRIFAIALIAVGIAMLVLGVVYHVRFMIGLRTIRNEMIREGFIYGQSRFPPSMTVITALILLLIGVFAILSSAYDIGPAG